MTCLWKSANNADSHKPLGFAAFPTGPTAGMHHNQPISGQQRSTLRPEIFCLKNGETLQVLSLKFGNAPKSGSGKSDKSGKQRILALKAPSFLLEVECVDESGNPGSGEFELSPPPKQGSDKSDKSDKSEKSSKKGSSKSSGKG